MKLSQLWQMLAMGKKHVSGWVSEKGRAVSNALTAVFRKEKEEVGNERS